MLDNNQNEEFVCFGGLLYLSDACLVLFKYWK